MACTYPSIHFSLDEDTLEITVGCPLCARFPPKMAPEGVQSAWFVVKTMTVDVFDTLTLSFLLDENILGK